ncbi:HAMP domain-containing histidine kinase [Desulfosporosinus fructosivorans]|uniref:histidine kinase n=1 Tax=Desulfosporosinus fructosivorans TaxID=2018669 RepID=A0A4Z0R2N7_9FIRM|nr:HAMP domain-containing sensor histidine kinase [Desulfosporosinus fructosivorans]TGE37342.1 HAMP domain-containing histidine kinase [Desulfosporosinus fructosivorans]
MKNNETRILKASLIIIGIILFCLSAVWLADHVFNGAFSDWFFSRFIVDARGSSNEKIGVIFRSWFEIKQFFINGISAFLMIFILCLSLSAHFYARYISKKDIVFITDSMNSFMNSNNDELTLPKKYSEIETQLIKIKAISQKHQQLVQTEMQRKNDLITYLAHDLKTPLASVIGYLSLLDEAPDMPAEQKAKYVGIALKKAYRLEDLINEFFEITRFNLQSIVLHKSKIKLAFMLQQMADEFYPMLTPEGKQAAINVPEDLILVGDADKLARVFNNILKNAIAYSYENSVIDISAAQQGGDVVITFTNQGDPIPAQKLDTIFEIFYRLDSARSTNTGGAGLGLAIAKEISTAHGGTITAESNPEHTIFTVKLPS